MSMSKKCDDIFKNVVVQKDQEKIRMYSHKNNNKYFRDKRLRNELIINISKLKLILGMRSITGMIYIRAVLDKINFVKKLFTYQIEDDAEVFIPADLTQSDLPISYRYYDPLILIVQSNMSAERCAYFKMKNSLKKEIYQQADTFTQMLERIGLRETKNEDFKKLAYKYTAINRTDNQHINVLHSIHSIGL